MDTQPSPERLLPINVVLDRTSFSRSTLYDHVKRGLFPKPVRLSANRVAFPESAVNAWVADKLAGAA